MALTEQQIDIDITTITDDMLAAVPPCDALLAPYDVPHPCPEPSVARVLRECPACGNRKAAFVCLYHLQRLQAGLIVAQCCWVPTLFIRYL